MVQELRRYPASCLGAVVALVGLAFLLVTGVAPLSALIVTVVVALQGVAGSALWTLLRRGAAHPVEQVGVGISVGTSASVLSGLVVTMLLGSSAGWLLPVAVSLVLWMFRSRLGWVSRPVRPRQSSRPVLFGLVALLVLGLASLVPNLVSYPLSWTGAWGGYHGDMLFFEAIATSLAQLGPLDSIFSPDAQIRYHWLVYAWVGQVAEAAGTAPFITLVRVLPYLAVAGTGLVAIAWVRRLTSVVWAPALAVLLLVLGGYVGATYGAVFNFDSPSQSLTMLWLVSFGLVIAVALPSTRLRSGLFLGYVAVAGLLMFAMAGGKISAGTMALAAVCWVALTGVLARRSWWRHGAVLGLSSLAAFVAAYVLIVSGSADPGGLHLFALLDRGSSVQGLNPIPGTVGIALGTMILLVAIAARWAGLVWLAAERDSRWAVDTQLGVGWVVGAVLTIIALSGGLNDTWFALAASAPLAVLSAAGAARAWDSLAKRRYPLLIACVVVALLSFGLVTALWMTGASGGNVWVSTWRWAAPLTGLAVATIAGGLITRAASGGGRRAFLAGAVLSTVLLSAGGRLLGFGTGLVGVQPGLDMTAFSPIGSFTEAIDRSLVREWTDQQVLAGEIIRSDAASGEIIATNVTASPLVPALTGRQTWASGIHYQAPYGRPAFLPILLERERESWAFIDDPSPATVAPLCAGGVRWLWIDPLRTEARDWSRYADVVVDDHAVVVLRLSTTACS